MTESWNAKSLDERYTHVGRTLVTSTDTVATIRDGLQLAFDSWGTRPEGQISSIVGTTRYGKTTGVRIFMNQFAENVGGRFVEINTKAFDTRSVAGLDYVESHNGRQATKPIMRVGIGPSPTYKGLLLDILFYLTGQHKFGRANHSKLLELMAEQLIKQGVKLIVFDEAHRVAREGATAHNMMAADVFSTLAKISKAEITLVGREGLRALYSDNQELEAMHEFSLNINPLPFPKDDESPFSKFLRAFQAKLPFDLKSDISSIVVAQHIHRYTKGSPGAVSLLMQLATKHAILNNLGCINQTVIGSALSQWKGLTGRKNPFLVVPENA